VARKSGRGRLLALPAARAETRDRRCADGRRLTGATGHEMRVSYNKRARR
jgi:hypothetical protein